MVQNVEVTQLLLSRVRSIRDDPWEEDALRATRLCLVDSLTCFSIGCRLEHFAPHLAVARNLLDAGSNCDDGVHHPSPFAVAYLYGQAANALDYDDTLVGHPGAPIIGAVLAAGIRHQISMDRLLRGITAGYEAHWILGTAATPSPERSTQVRTVGGWDTIAASLGIAVALDLDDATIERTIGVALIHSVIPFVAKWYDRPVPSLKNNLGWVAAGALLAVDLAMAGETGVTNPLEGKTGAWQMLGSDAWSLRPALYDKPAVCRTGFKEFPACWHIQPYLRAMVDVLPLRDHLTALSAIIVTGPPAIEKFCRGGLVGPADAAFSLPATISLLLGGVQPGPLWATTNLNGDSLRFYGMVQYRQGAKPGLSFCAETKAPHDVEVQEDDGSNPSASGLDTDGVLAKHARLAAPAIKQAMQPHLGGTVALEENNDPAGLYLAVSATLRDIPSVDR